MTEENYLRITCFHLEAYRLETMQRTERKCQLNYERMSRKIHFGDASIALTRNGKDSKKGIEKKEKGKEVSSTERKGIERKADKGIEMKAKKMKKRNKRKQSKEKEKKRMERVGR